MDGNDENKSGSPRGRGRPRREDEGSGVSVPGSIVGTQAVTMRLPVVLRDLYIQQAATRNALQAAQGHVKGAQATFQSEMIADMTCLRYACSKNPELDAWFSRLRAEYDQKAMKHRMRQLAAGRARQREERFPQAGPQEGEAG